VITFLEKHKAAKTSALAELFYPSLRVAQRRLETLTKHQAINREQPLYTREFVYYLKKSSQLRHHMILSEFYCKLSEVAEIHNFIVEPSLSNIRPDALTAFTYQGKAHIAFVEVEISNKGFDMAKYERFYASEDYKSYFPVFPRLIIVTDKGIPKTNLDIQIVLTDLTNFQL
jgi:hypothetical protein